jgi:hypothetical protein
VRSVTAMAIIRAGLAIQEAIRLVDDDETVTDGPRQLLHKLARTAEVLVDVPMPPQPFPDDEPGPPRRVTCQRCHLARIATALSAPECPRCGAVDNRL